MKCTQCNTYSSNNGKFCVSCGKKLINRLNKEKHNINSKNTNLLLLAFVSITMLYNISKITLHFVDIYYSTSQIIDYSIGIASILMYSTIAMVIQHKLSKILLFTLSFFELVFLVLNILD